MPKTVKIILIVAAVLILMGICLCVLTTGGIFTLGAFLPTSTPTMVPPRPVQPTSTQAASAPTIPAGDEEKPGYPVLLEPGEGFTLDGVKMKVIDVRYALINGGESAAYYVSGDEGFLVVVTIASETKELGFLYDNYQDYIRLVDLDTDESVDFDWAYWSGNESSTSNGYFRLSFPVNGTANRAALYMNDQVGIDITSMLPRNGEVDNPWLDYKSVFTINGIDLRVQSVLLVSNYTPPTGDVFRKHVLDNKIAVVKFTSPREDLSGLGDWDPLLINPLDFEFPYESGYIAWTTDTDKRSGVMEIAYEVQPETSDFVLYIPFDTLIDLTPIVQKK